MKNIWKKLKGFLFDGFLFIIIYEILEEMLEDLIAFAVTDIFFGVLSKVFYVTITQTIKYGVKKVIKVLTRREGDDKMKLFKKIFYILYFNKCTIIMSLLSAFSAFSAYIILPLPLWARISIGAAILMIGILCAIQIGWENLGEIQDRLKLAKEKRLLKREKRKEKKSLKMVRKQNKRQEKEIKKIAARLEKDKLLKMKMEEEAKLADMRLGLMEDAKREYEEKLKREQESKTGEPETK